MSDTSDVETARQAIVTTCTEVARFANAVFGKHADNLESAALNKEQLATLEMALKALQGAAQILKEMGSG